MKATNTLLLLVLLLLSPRFVSAQDDVQQRKDSLLKGIVQAQQQHNLDLENSSKFKLLSLMFNNHDYDDFTQRAKKDIVFFKKNNFWKSYYNTQYSLITTYGMQGELAKVVSEATNLYEEAKQNSHLFGIAKATALLSLAYGIEHRFVDAEKYALESVKVASELVKKEPDDKENHFLLMQNQYRLANALLFQDKFDELKKQMPQWKKYLDNYEKRFKEVNKDALSDYYDFNARIYANLSEFVKAEQYCDSVEQITPDVASLDRIMEYRAMICEGRGQYDKAIYWLDTLIEHNTKISELPVVVVFLRNKARVLSKIGKSEESWQIFDRAFQLNDSIHGKEFNAQLDELRTQYEVDKITAEKERNRNYFLFALGGCGLLAITLGIRIYYSRLVTKKNRTMVVQIKELKAEQQRREEEMLRKTTFETPETTNDFCPESRRDKLCLAIRDLLLKDKIYRNPTLNRDNMLERLGTSKNLFIEAFQQCFNMPLTDYINELRLNDAITLLEQSDLSIEELSEKAGFGTDRTFRRQFQAKYNISPQNYRKLAKEKPFR